MTDDDAHHTSSWLDEASLKRGLLLLAGVLAAGLGFTAPEIYARGQRLSAIEVDVAVLKADHIEKAAKMADMKMLLATIDERLRAMEKNQEVLIDRMKQQR